jgi:hypothetical protein
MIGFIVGVASSSWCCLALATATLIFGSTVFAALSLADALRKLREDRERARFEDHVREALTTVAADIVPGLLPPDGKPLSRADRRTLRGIEAASEKTGAAT